MNTNLLKLTCGLALLGAAATTQAQTFTTLDDPNATSGTYAQGISGNNIVGYYNTSSGLQYGFIYNGSTYTDLIDPLSGQPGQWGIGTVYNANGAFGISGNNIAGYYYPPLVNGSSAPTGFLYNSGLYTTLICPLGLSTNPRGISGNNIVGLYNNGTSVGHSFLYNGSTGTYTDLSDPLGVAGTYAYGISGNNIVGAYANSAHFWNGFLYNGSTYTTLSDPLGVNGTLAEGISGNDIVGAYADSAGHMHGFLYDGTTYTTVDDPLGVNGTSLTGIDGNSLVGTYTDSAGVSHGFETTFTVTATPEPSTLALSAVGGLGGLLLFRRRK